MTSSIVIAGMARTPLGGLLGDFKGIAATRLGAEAISSAVKRSGLAPSLVDGVLMGNVLGAGQGQAPARQAALGAGLSEATVCVTLNKMCGSGMQAIMIAHDQIRAGTGQTIVAGGMESMSNAPYLLPGARAGLRMGHGSVVDHMFMDGLEDAYDRGRLMGTFAEDAAGVEGFTREAQDDFARLSLARALKADFTAELTPVRLMERGTERLVATDEQPAKARPDKISILKPAFRPDGTITAANASSISDGAAAVVLMEEAAALRGEARPLARILGHATHAAKPAHFPSAPVGAMLALCTKLDLPIQSFDLFEINEAFAVVPMIAMKHLGIGVERVNVLGGACALGHPIGASGARIVVTLINALRLQGARRGMASVCIGGGEATALALELI